MAEIETQPIGARSFAGNLAHFSLPEILYLVSLSSKTGRLTLARPDGGGLIVLRRGRVIYAASSAARETLGHILIRRGLITQDALDEALRRQHTTGRAKRVGAVLVEMKALRLQDVEEAVRDQIRAVLVELCGWNSGSFRFRACDIAEGEEIEVDAHDFLMAAGLDPGSTLLSAEPDVAGGSS